MPIFLLAMSLSAATPALVTVPGGCGSGANAGACLGPMQVPSGQQATFKQAGQMAIDAIHAPQFRADLAAFIAQDASNGAQAAAWHGLTAEGIVADMQRKMPGMRITTFGGPKALALYHTAHNVAFDGSANGPIRLNQYALPRAASAIADTIAHETSHRFGLTHPHSNMHQMAVAQCEPPYVIGSLVRKYAEGAGWKPGINDCRLFR